MLQPRKKSRRLSARDVGAHWISYSDMMASLLLVFVLVLVYSIYQYYVMLETKTQELEQQAQILSLQEITLGEQQAQLEQSQIALAKREEDLLTLQVDLQGKEEELALVQVQLDEQESELEAARAALKETEEQQALLQLQLADQQTRLEAAQVVLQSQKSELENQQRRIDELVGVRSEIIRELSSALSAANLRATVDEQTGDIVLDSAVFFDTAQSAIKAEGQAYLDRFVPVYLSVLLREEYADYLGEIIIEGHTDTQGTYMVNLELSQNRALSVAKYCLGMESLTAAQVRELQQILTAKGRSYSDPILNGDGTVNMTQSRRVEFKFRLKDAEMITEMNRILSEMN